MSHIVTHEDIHQSLPLLAWMARFWAERKRRGQHPIGLRDDLPAVEVKGSLPARVNHGRWLVDCPTCGSAMFGSKLTPLFWCVECGSPENDGKWYEVMFPAEHETIDRLLEMRSGVENQHWELGEDLEEVVFQNLEHGVGV